MNWSFFKGKNNVNTQNVQNNKGIEEVFQDTINEKRKEDPLIGIKIGAKDILNTLINSMKDTKGVHIESLLCILGSLAGYSCQAYLRKELIERKGLKENQVFTIIEAKNGCKYYFGELINKPLVENQLSVWSLAAGAIKILGINDIIDIGDIFRHVTEMVGQDNYGIPRIPEGHRPGDIPFHYVKDLWPVFLLKVEYYCTNPNEWPVMFGLAIQEGIILGKDVLDPLLSLSIAMESAIPMAKADINFSVM